MGVKGCRFFALFFGARMISFRITAAAFGISAPTWGTKAVAFGTGTVAFGIGTSEVEHVLATQTLIQKKYTIGLRTKNLMLYFVWGGQD